MGLVNPSRVPAVLAAQRLWRLAVSETHELVRIQDNKPRSGDIGLVDRSMSPLRGYGRYGIGYPGACAPWLSAAAAARLIRIVALRRKTRRPN